MSTIDGNVDEDDWVIKPYQYEPLADEKWIAKYNEERRVEEERHRVLQARREGKDKVDNWCKCGHCSTELLENVNEFQCCIEVEACAEALHTDEVLHEIGYAPGCVTLHPGFKPVCLEVWPLILAGRKHRKMDKKKDRKNLVVDNRYLRSVACREYRQLVHGFLEQRSTPLPACANAAIRSKFRDGN